jgi:hypothetical protein
MGRHANANATLRWVVTSYGSRYHHEKALAFFHSCPDTYRYVGCDQLGIGLRTNPAAAGLLDRNNNATLVGPAWKSLHDHHIILALVGRGAFFVVVVVVVVITTTTAVLEIFKRLGPRDYRSFLFCEC